MGNKEELRELLEGCEVSDVTAKYIDGIINKYDGDPDKVSIHLASGMIAEVGETITEVGYMLVVDDGSVADQLGIRLIQVSHLLMKWCCDAIEHIEGEPKEQLVTLLESCKEDWEAERDVPFFPE